MEPVVVKKPARQKIIVPASTKLKMIRPRKANTTSVEALFESLYDAIIITDLSGAILQANMRAEALLGFSVNELVQQSITTILPDMDKSFFHDFLSNAQEHRYTLLEWICARNDESTISCEIAVSGITWNQQLALCYSIRDITQRKEMENMLTMANDAINSAATGIVLADEDGLIQLTNPAFLVLAGYDTEVDLIGCDIREFLADEKPVSEIFDAVHNQCTCSLELKLQPCNGDCVPVLAACSPYIEDDNSVAGIVFSFDDISERIKAEELRTQAQEKQLEAERIQSRLDTITTLGYAINSPLQALLSMVELDQRDDYREQIDRIVAIVNELHDETPLPRSTTADGNTCYALKSPAVSTPCSPSRILIADDEDMIRQLFSRIISTAFPSLEVSSVSDGKAAMEAFKSNHHAIVVLDVVMPEMTGSEVYAEMHQYCKSNSWELPHVIFCTGFLPSAEIAEIVGDGKQHSVITKPVTSSALIQKLKMFVPSG